MTYTEDTHKTSITDDHLPHTHVIWDFNGTVLDDVQLGIDCVNPMLEARGLPTIPDVEAYRAVFGFPIRDYYERLGFDFHREDYETVLAPEWVARYLAGEPACGMNPGVLETIAAIAARGIPQIMLSATEAGQLTRQLARLDLSDAFEEVLALDNIHAKSKAHLAVEWKVCHPGAHPLFIGDTEHDAAVADTIGADCVLFTGGHASPSRLAACHKPLIDRMEDVLAYI